MGTFNKLFSNLPTIRRIADILQKSPTSEPQKSYMWEISFTGGVPQQLGDIRFFAKSCTLPKRSIGQIKTEFLGLSFVNAGKEQNPNTIDVVFWDDENLTVYNFLRKWHELVLEPKYGVSHFKTDYKSIMNIKLKDTTDFIETHVFSFDEVFPMEIQDISLNYESSEIMEIRVTFSYGVQTADNIQKFGKFKDVLRGIIN